MKDRHGGAFEFPAKNFCGEICPISHKDRRRTIAVLHGKKVVFPLWAQKRTTVAAVVKRWESLVDAS
jgi:hypothetical protein